MLYVVFGFGILLLAMGIAMLLYPAAFVTVVSNNSDSLALFLLAILGRLVLGTALVLSASATDFPLLVQILGWLVLFGAVAIVAIGKKRFSRLVNWGLQRFGSYARVSAMVAVLFGGFLVYVAV